MDRAVIQRALGQARVDVDVVEVDGQVLVRAADIAKIVGVKNVRDAVEDFDDDEKRIVRRQTAAGPRPMIFLTELGFYRFVGKSRKAAGLRKMMYAAFSARRQQGDVAQLENAQLWQRAREALDELKHRGVSLQLPGPDGNRLAILPPPTPLELFLESEFVQAGGKCCEPEFKMAFEAWLVQHDFDIFDTDFGTLPLNIAQEPRPPRQTTIQSVRKKTVAPPPNSMGFVVGHGLSAAGQRLLAFEARRKARDGDVLALLHATTRFAFREGARTSVVEVVRELHRLAPAFGFHDAHEHFVEMMQPRSRERKTLLETVEAATGAWVGDTKLTWRTDDETYEDFPLENLELRTSAHQGT